MFQTYVLAASIMILKLMLQPWMTVVQTRWEPTELSTYRIVVGEPVRTLH